MNLKFSVEPSFSQPRTGSTIASVSPSIVSPHHHLIHAAKNRFAKPGQMVSGGDGGPDGLASIFNKNGT